MHAIVKHKGACIYKREHDDRELFVVHLFLILMSFKKKQGKYIEYIILKVQEIEKARILADEKGREAQQKEYEARQLEQELREANKRVSFYSIFLFLHLLTKRNFF
jgi:hypothetical protein